MEFSSRNITVNALSFGAVNTNMNKDLTEHEKEITKNKVILIDFSKFKTMKKPYNLRLSLIITLLPTDIKISPLSPYK